MIEHLQALVNSDPALVRRGRWTSADLLLEIGTKGYVVAIRQGRIDKVIPVEINVSQWDFAIRGAPPRPGPSSGSRYRSPATTT